MIQSLLTAMHDDPYHGGHFSADKMFSKLVSRYWWPQMRDSIRLHVQACTLCQQYNYNRQKKAGSSTPYSSHQHTIFRHQHGFLWSFR